MSHAMPGTFPGPDSPLRASGPAHHLEANSDLTSQHHQDTFARRELVNFKTVSQKHLIGQLGTLTHLLIGIQFLRYTYSSCLPPVLGHCLVEFLLHGQHFASAGPESGRRIFADQLDSQEQLFRSLGLEFDRASIVRFIMNKTRSFIFWKYLAVCVYHTVFVLLWLRPVALSGRLRLLEAGLWYCLSFLGQPAPAFLPDSSRFVQMWHLGLYQLLILDTVILALQLIVYQCIYLQSTISPRGIRLNEPEVNICRSVLANVDGQVDLEQDGLPDVLHVKLYETLEGVSLNS